MKEETKKEKEKWIFRYISANLEEIDMGPYPSYEECKKARDEMAQYGVICSEPIKVPPNYKLYKGSFY